MKNLTFIFLLMVIPSILFGQGAPKGFNYQAVARDYNGKEMVNQSIIVRVSIVNTNDSVIWVEEHTTQTNQFGLFNLVIGQGTRKGGQKDKFSEIDWGADAYSMKVEINFNDGNGFQNMGKSRLLSVPYALYSDYSANGGSGGDPNDLDKDPTNEIQSLSINGKHLSIMLNDVETNGVDLNVDDADADPTNEIQDLMLNNNSLNITNNPDANPVDLSKYLDNTDKQTLYNKDDSIGISGGNKINLDRFLDNTDKQNLTLETDSLRISGGNAISTETLKNPESVKFYAKRTVSEPLVSNAYLTLIFDDIKLNDGGALKSSGYFIPPVTGLYSFYLNFSTTSDNEILLYLDGINVDSFPVTLTHFSFMRYLTQGAILEIRIHNKTVTQSTVGIATFAGFLVY